MAAALSIAVLVLAILAAGSAIAATVPAFGVAPQVSLGRMLPATTAFYLSVDLNPVGSTKTSLERIKGVFTRRLAWDRNRTVWQLKKSLHGSADTAKCFRKTGRQAASLLQDLGHDTTLALTGMKGIKLSDLSPVTGVSSALPPSSSLASPFGEMGALKRDLVLLAPIDVQRTLFGALFGPSISFRLPQKHSIYRGTMIYQERLSVCGHVSAGTVDSIYAADFKGWVLLGLVPQALDPVIDAGLGLRPTLASVGTYRRIMAQLPAGQLATYYGAGTTLKQAGFSSAFNMLPKASSLASSSYASVEKPSAGALAVDRTGFSFTALVLDSATTVHHPAGALAGALPSTVEAFVSLDGLRAALTHVLAQARQLGALQQQPGTGPSLAAVISDISGEADIAIFHPRGRVRRNDPGTVPVVAAWQVANGAKARHDISNLIQRARVGNMATSTASDGTTYFHKGGYGYTVRRGWAYASTNIAQAINLLSTKRAHALGSVSGYRSAMPPHAAVSSIWYVSLTGLRHTLEAALLPDLGRADGKLYRTQYEPLLAHFVALSGSAGTEGSTGYAKLELTIS